MQIYNPLTCKCIIKQHILFLSYSSFVVMSVYDSVFEELTLL